MRAKYQQTYMQFAPAGARRDPGLPLLAVSVHDAAQVTHGPRGRQQVVVREMVDHIVQVHRRQHAATAPAASAAAASRMPRGGEGSGMPQTTSRQRRRWWRCRGAAVDAASHRCRGDSVVQRLQRQALWRARRVSSRSCCAVWHLHHAVVVLVMLVDSTGKRYVRLGSPSGTAATAR